MAVYIEFEVLIMDKMESGITLDRVRRNIVVYSVKGGVKLSNYGGIKLTTYHKNLLHVWTFFPVHLEKFRGINPCLFRSLMR